MGSIAAECVLNDNDFELGMVQPKVFQPATSCIAFAIVFDRTILLDDWFWHQGDDFLEVGMDDGSTEQLVGIGDAASAMFFDQTGITVNGLGGEVASAIEGHEIAAVEKGVSLQGLGPLKAAENLGVGRPQVVGVEGVEDGPHLGIARDAIDAVDGTKVIGGVLATLVEGEQGRIFKGKHGIGRHKSVSKRNVWLIPVVSNPRKARMKGLVKSVG